MGVPGGGRPSGQGLSLAPSAKGVTQPLLSEPGAGDPWAPPSTGGGSGAATSLGRPTPPHPRWRPHQTPCLAPGPLSPRFCALTSPAQSCTSTLALSPHVIPCPDVPPHPHHVELHWIPRGQGSVRLPRMGRPPTRALDGAGWGEATCPGASTTPTPADPRALPSLGR